VDNITKQNIEDMIRDGRIMEAGTLLTMQQSAFSPEKVQALKLELEKLSARAKAAISQAEDLEISGRIEEARALYQSVLLYAVDYPGIQEHIKRLDEALRLTRAVKLRSRRIRKTSPAPKEAAGGKRRMAILGAVMAVGLTVAILLLVVPKPQPLLVTAPEKTVPADPPARERESPAPSEPVAAQQPPVSSAIPVAASVAAPSAPPLAETPQAGESSPAEPVGLSQNELLQSPPALPSTDDENGAAVIVSASVPATDNQPPNSYTVRPGDSLSLIAKRLFCNESAWRKIYQLNRDEIADSNILHSGMVLRLDGIENRCPAEQ
jgi:nucleoid-associated protein YgaU